MTKRSWKASLAALLALCLVTSLPRFSSAKSAGSSPDQVAILAVLTAQQAAWNKGDIDAFLQGY